MPEPDLVEIARGLPHAWRSEVVGRLGRLRVKVLRMDASAGAEEQHAHDEALTVLDGMLALTLAGQPRDVLHGETVVVPAGVPHAVRAGSSGVLLIFDDAGAATIAG